MEAIGSSSDQKVVLNVPTWLSRGTLDAIGQGRSFFPRDENEPSSFPPAAFDVQFDSIDNDDHPLFKKYNNLMSVLSRIFSLDCNVTLCCSQERRFWTSLCTTDFHNGSFQVHSAMDPRVDG